MRISDWSSDVCSSDLTASSTSGALPSAAWITRAPASAASADISTKSEWRAASSGGRVISAAASHPGASASARPEERRVGQEWVRTGRSRWSPYHINKNQYQYISISDYYLTLN